MRKKVFGRKLSRGRKAREALFVSLIKALIMHGKIVTTKAKAKAIKKDIDKIISLSKKDSLAAKRRASSYLRNDRVLTRILFEKVGKAFAKRESGFTRTILLPRRKGDSAEMVRVEWVEKIDISEKKEPSVKEKKVAPGRSEKSQKVEAEKNRKTKTK